jgi:tetratricopeptide (TPR) repeat protein
MRTKTIANLSRIACAGLLLLLTTTVGCGHRELEPEGLLATANQQMQSGDFARARDTLLQACADHPQSLTAHVNLAIAYWRLNDFTAAAAALNRATELAPENTQIWELRAHLLIDTGNPEGAIEVLNAIEEPTVSTLTLRSMAEQLSGNPDQALYHLEQALKQDPFNPAALHNLAVLQRDEFNAPIEAMTAWRRFREASPQNPRASVSDDRFLEQATSSSQSPVDHVEVAVTPPAPEPTPAPEPVVPPTNTTENVERSVISSPPPTSTEQASDNAEPSAKSLIEKANREIKAGNNDSALLALKDAVQRYPDNADAVWALAVFYDKQVGLKTRADGLYKTFSDMFPDDPRTNQIRKHTRQPAPPPPATEVSPNFFQQGLAHYAKAEWDDAIAAYRRALSLDPRSESCAYNLGLAYKAKNDLDAAAAAFRHALSINPDMVKSLYMLGLTEIQRKRNADALVYLNRLIKIQPDFAKAHYLLGTVYQTENQAKTAAHHFDRFLDLDPNDKAAPQVKRWLQQYRR